MPSTQRIIKRLFDITASFAGLLLLSPCAAVVIIILKCTSKGPVFFTQTRIGQFVRPFRCVKFRTMALGSEKHGTITAANDIRITPIGKILRKWKLDEFPQLWNVLIGKMSFVGPRPDVAGYADKLTGADRDILQLQPGITGPATLYFRYEEELLAAVENPVVYNDTYLWPAKVRLNRAYLSELSLVKDIGYILITIFPALNTLFKLIPVSPRTPGEFESSPLYTT